MNEDEILLVEPTPTPTPEPTPIIIVAEGENDGYYLQTAQNINEFINDIRPTVSITAAFIQLCIVLLTVVAFYKLLKIFF